MYVAVVIAKPVSIPKKFFRLFFIVSSFKLIIMKVSITKKDIIPIIYSFLAHLIL